MNETELIWTEIRCAANGTINRNTDEPGVRSPRAIYVGNDFRKLTVYTQAEELDGVDVNENMCEAMQIFLGGCMLIIQLFVNGESALSYNRPKFCPNATWNPNATTFANRSLISNARNIIFVSINNTIYVTDFDKHRLFVWFQGDMQFIQLDPDGNNPSSLFVTINGDVYIDNGNNKRIDKWILKSYNSSKAATVSGRCYGLFIDINNMLYCSVHDLHIVEKISLNDSESQSITVAGKHSDYGNTLDKLNSPFGIYVHPNLTLYVADYGNHRIQCFPPEEMNGITVTGKTVTNNIGLNGPVAVIIDMDDNLFIADRDNNRIIKLGQTGFQCLFGCSQSQGSAANQFIHPNSLAFNKEGNIFVSDISDKPIKMFALIANTCNESVSSHQITTSITQNTIPTTILSTVHQDNFEETGESSTNTLSTSDSKAISASTSSVELFHSTTYLTTTIRETTIRQSILTFIPKQCNSTAYIGSNCNISNNICNVSNPCQNNGTCISINNETLDFNCSCSPGFNGTYCEFNHQLCKSHTCLNHGKCFEILSKTFNCTCNDGWQGIHCESMINYCNFKNVTCLNNGVCRPLLLNYTCECLGNNYYVGRHCEITLKNIIIFKMISKSFSYIAIIAMITVALFIIIMDILKYGFGIDPVAEERKRIRQEKLMVKRRKHIIQRFVYVNPPSEQLSTDIPTITVIETTV
ncbi:hypothetical protein I4U23_005260 [Adineta vaga]|nr:hypothetical protein I4U23_005260 [Adineta vaga]